MYMIFSFWSSWSNLFELLRIHGNSGWGVFHIWILCYCLSMIFVFLCQFVSISYMSLWSAYSHWFLLVQIRTKVLIFERETLKWPTLGNLSQPGLEQDEKFSEYWMRPPLYLTEYGNFPKHTKLEDWCHLSEPESFLTLEKRKFCH